MFDPSQSFNKFIKILHFMFKLSIFRQNSVEMKGKLQHNQWFMHDRIISVESNKFACSNNF